MVLTTAAERSQSGSSAERAWDAADVANVSVKDSALEFQRHLADGPVQPGELRVPPAAPPVPAEYSSARLFLSPSALLSAPVAESCFPLVARAAR